VFFFWNLASVGASMKSLLRAAEAHRGCARRCPP
jgi:hypothetical protein